MDKNEHFRAGWLRGFFDGEGSSAFKRGKRPDTGYHYTQYYLSVGNTDTSLMLYCCESLGLLGIGYTRFQRKEIKGRKPFITLHICRKSEIIKFSQLVGFSAPAKAARLRSIIDWINRDTSATWKERRDFMLNLWNTGHTARCIGRKLGLKEGAHSVVAKELKMIGVSVGHNGLGRKRCACLAIST